MTALSEINKLYTEWRPPNPDENVPDKPTYKRHGFLKMKRTQTGSLKPMLVKTDEFGNMPASVHRYVKDYSEVHPREGKRVKQFSRHVGGETGVAKRGPRLTPEQKAEQKRQRTQARVGLGSNVLGLTAGTVATAGALRDTRFKEGGKVSRALHSVGSKIPKPITNLSDKWVTTAPRKAALLAGGGLALQAGNMGGDVVANRVLARSAQQPAPGGKVKKSAGKVAGGAAATGAVGTAAAAALARSAAAARAGVHAEDAARAAAAGGKRRRGWLLPAAAGGAVVAGGGGGYALARRRRKEDYALAKAYYDESITSVYVSKADHTGGHGSADWVDKAYRRYDPEADRQRRLGLAAGTGVGGGLLLGAGAAKQYTTKVALRDGGEHVKGIAVRPKRGKAALLLTGGALASGGLGAAAYRKGLSERNNPWN